MSDRTLACIIIAFLIALYAIFFMIPAQAHDLWINTQAWKNLANQHCCGDDDCKVVLGVKHLPNHYLLPSGETVLEANVLPSDDGLYWRCGGSSIRCFFVPRESF